MDILKRLYFHTVRHVVGGFAKVIGPIHAPYTHKALCYEDVLGIRRQIQEGDILIDRTNGELTTAVIPGFWKHAMVYIGEDRVIEAVGEGVRSSWLVDAVMKTDNMAVLRKKGGLTPTQKLLLKDWLSQQVGKEYDFEMNTGSNKKFYCSELAVKAIAEALGYEYFQPMSRLGFMTVTPDDIYLAKNKMEIIWEKRG